MAASLDYPAKTGRIKRERASEMGKKANRTSALPRSPKQTRDGPSARAPLPSCRGKRTNAQRMGKTPMFNIRECSDASCQSDHRPSLILTAVLRNNFSSALNTRSIFLNNFSRFRPMRVWFRHTDAPPWNTSGFVVYYRKVSPPKFLPTLLALVPSFPGKARPVICYSEQRPARGYVM